MTIAIGIEGVLKRHCDSLSLGRAVDVDDVDLKAAPRRLALCVAVRGTPVELCYDVVGLGRET
jgi:hypothetical protein